MAAAAAPSMEDAVGAVAAIARGADADGRLSRAGPGRNRERRLFGVGQTGAPHPLMCGDAVLDHGGLSHAAGSHAEHRRARPSRRAGPAELRLQAVPRRRVNIGGSVVLVLLRVARIATTAHPLRKDLIRRPDGAARAPLGSSAGASLVVPRGRQGGAVLGVTQLAIQELINLVRAATIKASKQAADPVRPPHGSPLAGQRTVVIVSGVSVTGLILQHVRRGHRRRRWDLAEAPLGGKAPRVPGRQVPRSRCELSRLFSNTFPSRESRR